MSFYKRENIQILIKGRWIDLKDAPADVEVKISNLGEISIRAEKTPLKKIRIIFSVKPGMKVYCDAWERGYGDLKWSGGQCRSPWYCLLTDSETTCGFGVKTLPNSFCSWHVGGGRVCLLVNIQNGSGAIVLNGRTLIAAEMVFGEYKGDVFSAARKFCRKMCREPRLPKTPVFGGNDWYCCYGDNSWDKILRHAERIAECAPVGGPRPYMVVDDGWQLCAQTVADEKYNYNGGPWHQPNNKFGDMKRLAETLEDIGVNPGIWIRPLLTIENMPEEYILKRDGIKTVLDPSVPQVLKYVRRCAKRLAGWGYKLIKHDFTSYDICGRWGYEMGDDPFSGGVEFRDKTKTSAEIIKNLYMAIRDGAGDGVMVMGCNTFSHLSAGIFEIQRTGDDTSGVDWERTRKMGVNTLAFRMMQHGTFYASDADCVGITKSISFDKNRQWLDAVAKSGTPLFVSIAEDAYGDDVKKALREAFLKNISAKKCSRPLDWLKNPVPLLWKSSFGTDEYKF